MNAAIAQHLNISEEAILRVEEWSAVFFVVCRKFGARFVSKKVVQLLPSREAAAEAIAAGINANVEDTKASVWAKAGHVRIYLRYEGDDMGYLSIDCDGYLINTYLKEEMMHPSDRKELKKIAYFAKFAK
jgi:hypothetical protein